MILKTHVDQSVYPRWYHRLSAGMRVSQYLDAGLLIATIFFWRVWQLWLINGVFVILSAIGIVVMIAEDVHIYRLGKRRYK